MSKTSISYLFEAANLAINNTERNPEMQQKMASYGISQKRIQAGKTLLQQAIMLHEVKEGHYEESWLLSQQLKTEMNATLAAFKEHVKVARLVFRHDPVVLHTLKINRIAGRRWEWPRQALHFYTRLEAHASVMAPFGISLEVLQQSKAAIEAILEQKEQRVKKKGEAENSTQERNEAIRALRSWLSEFHSIARIAFKDHPQMLEVFGIIVPSAR